MAEHDGQRRGGRTAVALTAGLATVAVLAVVAVVAAWRGRDGDDDSSALPIATAGPQTGQGDTPGPVDLVVRDGDRVEASGQVIVTPGKPARFCADAPTTLALREGPPTCMFGYDLVGLDPATLPSPSVTYGATVAVAHLTGRVRGGTFQLESIGPHRPAPPVTWDDSLPCAPPAGGWKGVPSADNSALHDYLQAHPERFRPPRVTYPDGRPTGTTEGPQPTEVVVVEVVAGDADAEARELRKRFDGNLCVVSAPGRPSIADQEAMRERVMAVVRPLMEDRSNAVYAAGGADRVTVDLMVLTPKLYDAFAAVGFDALVLNPWLRPVR